MNTVRPISLSAVGRPALLGFVDRRLTAVLVLTMRRERIQVVQVIADPRMLKFISAQLPALA